MELIGSTFCSPASKQMLFVSIVDSDGVRVCIICWNCSLSVGNRFISTQNLIANQLLLSNSNSNLIHWLGHLIASPNGKNRSIDLSRNACFSVISNRIICDKASKHRDRNWIYWNPARKPVWLLPAIKQLCVRLCEGLCVFTLLSCIPQMKYASIIFSMRRISIGYDGSGWNEIGWRFTKNNGIDVYSVCTGLFSFFHSFTRRPEMNYAWAHLLLVVTQWVCVSAFCLVCHRKRRHGNCMFFSCCNINKFQTRHDFVCRLLNGMSSEGERFLFASIHRPTDRMGCRWMKISNVGYSVLYRARQIGSVSFH